jgi:hypothetical protein
LLWREFRCCSPECSSQQPFFAILLYTLHPLADGAFCDAQSFGDFFMRPTVALELKRTPPTLFFPINCAGILNCHASVFIKERQV